MKLAHGYDGLLDLVDGRKSQVEALLSFLEKETNWLAAPASTCHHMNVAGGLVAHSQLTTRTLLGLRDALAAGSLYSDETCVIVGLFHDVGKVGSPGVPLYRPSRGQAGAEWEVNKELVTLGVAVRSLYHCAKFVALSDEEAQAICYHDGQYVTDNFAVKNRECPLTLLLHFADLWSSHVIEKRDPIPNVLSLLERGK